MKAINQLHSRKVVTPGERICDITAQTVH